MTSDASPPTCSRIDETRFGLVIDKVREVLNEVDSHKALVFDGNFWRWQYQATPTGRTRVYGILSGGQLKGYYHVPVYDALINQRACQLAMVQEVAVSRDLRGQGMFRKLADFVTDDLMKGGIEAAYTFPNRKSIHTFLKYNGYRRIATLPTYILPVNSGAIMGSKVNLRGLEKTVGRLTDRFFQAVKVPRNPGAVVSRHPCITAQMREVFSAYQRQHPVALLRDGRYLTWRFEHRPGGRHFYFSLRRGAQVRAAAIFKLDDVLGNPALLLMDYAHYPGEEGALIELIQRVKRQGPKEIGHPFNLIFTCANSGFLPWLKKIGFFAVPPKLNPRPLDLVVRNLAGTSGAIFDPSGWHVTLADWDVM